MWYRYTVQCTVQYLLWLVPQSAQRHIWFWFHHTWESRLLLPSIYKLFWDYIPEEMGMNFHVEEGCGDIKPILCLIHQISVNLKEIYSPIFCPMSFSSINYSMVHIVIFIINIGCSHLELHEKILWQNCRKM
jgi:hypothetical protein